MSFLLDRMLEISRRFLRWWLAELAALVPGALRRRLACDGEPLVVEVEDGAIVVTTAGWGRELARLPLAGGAAPAEARHARRLRGGRATIVLRLPAARALRKTIELPLGAEASLGDILRFELERQTPFRPEDVYAEHRVVARMPAAQRLAVELTLLPRSMADPALAALARFGLRPTRLVGKMPDGAPWSCRLLARAPARASRSRLARVLDPALAVLALALAAGAGYLPVLRAERELAEVRAQVLLERRRADETLALRERVAALRRRTLHVVGRKRAQPSFLEVWDELTRVLPDDSFAFELRARGPHVELLGQAAAATGLIDLIAASPLFQAASFRSPITSARGEPGERFHLAFDVGARAGSAAEAP